MFIQTLMLTSALVAAPQAQAPSRPTPDTPPPAGQAGQPSTARPGADKPHGEHGGVAAADAAFVKKAADGGLAEVALAKLAQEKASSDEVKAFAAKLEKDHTQANTELTQVASQKNVTLPSAPSKMHQAKQDKLSKLSGAEFDKAYVAAMVEDHQKDVRDFQRQATSGADADVKAFAAKTLPTLKDHLQHVQELAKSVGAKKTTS
jgi:putative membrane protein